MKIIPILFILISSCFTLQAQKLDHYFVAVTSQTAAFPFTSYFPIHPGAEVGFNYWHQEGLTSSHRLNAFLGAYYHRKIEYGIYLKGEYCYSLQLFPSLDLDLPVGLGYQHSFNSGETYSQNDDTGAWEKKTHAGKPHGLVNFGVGLNLLKDRSINPYIRHEATIDQPFYNGFTTIRSVVKIGIQFKLVKG